MIVALAGVFFIALTLVGMASFAVIGSEVAPDGSLVEPFFLIPLSYLSGLLGIDLLAVSGALALFSRRA